MNQPNDDRFKKIEERIDKLEQENTKSIEAERLLLRLSRMHDVNVKELLALCGRIDLDTGDARERFDVIERTLFDHGNKLDRIEEHQFKQDDRLGRIEELLVQLVTRLPQPEGE
ncbi:MAG TPA: hypothetical protein VHV10_02665 [Ktedonobacteraceae bacterium]|jgi:hypothetical protein|nr:hypothetical protein [Ktedonobacteraceae bacterium]